MWIDVYHWFEHIYRLSRWLMWFLSAYSLIILFTCEHPALPPKNMSTACRAYSLLLYQVYAGCWSNNPSSLLPSFCSSGLPSLFPSSLPPSFCPDTIRQDEVWCLLHNLNFLYYKMDKGCSEINFISQWSFLKMLSLFEFGDAPQMRKKLGVVLSTKVSGRHV